MGRKNTGLSDEAKKIARSSRTPAKLREFAVTSRRLDDMPAEVEFYRWVHAAASSQADALLAVHRLEVIKGDSEEFDRVVGERDALKHELAIAATRDEVKSREIQRLTVQAVGAGANVRGD